MRFSLSVHTPSIRWYTRRRLDGPTRIGLSSGTKIVLLPHPLAQAITSSAQAISVGIGVDSNRCAATIEVLQQRESDGRECAVKHWAPASSPSRRSGRCPR